MSLHRLFAVFGTTALLAGCAADASDAHPDRTGQAASAITQSLSIPAQMPSVNIDFAAHTATFPLHRAHGPDRRPAYFILTDTSNLAEAVRLGINWSPKLTHALGTAAVQHADIRRSDDGDDEDGDSLGFRVRLEGGVDFAPHRVVVPGPDLFPLGDGTAPGSIGDAKYSPLFAGRDGIVYNGPQIANKTGLHDKVVAIDYERMTVTMRLTAGFYNGRDVLYLSTDSSVPPIAALEAATYAPNLASAPNVGVDDPAVSAREAIIPIVNGAMGVDNPDRQGLRSAVAGEGDPLNIIREEPECSDPTVPASCSALQYSPLWDVHPVLWTQAAIDAGLRHRVTAHQDVEALFNAGQLVSAAPGGPSNQDPEIQGLRAAGVVVNCPPVFVAP
jgi:hypothetical protein